MAGLKAARARGRKGESGYCDVTFSKNDGKVNSGSDRGFGCYNLSETKKRAKLVSLLFLFLSYLSWISKLEYGIFL